MTEAPPIGRHVRLTDEWELIFTYDGEVALGYKNGPDRWLIKLDDIEEPDDLETGVNFLRSQGEITTLTN